MDANTTQILTLAIAGLVGAFNVWIALQNRRLEKQTTVIHEELAVVKKEINGQSKMLNEAIAGEATALGKAAGIAQERARTDLATQAVEPNDKGHAHE